MRGTGTREVAHKPRQDFSIQKVKFFLLVAEYEVTSREKSGPFLLHLK